MHPALHSWRDDVSGHFVRALAYVGGLAVLSIVAGQFFQSPMVTTAITPVHRPDWIEVERPFPAFALSIPEAAGQPSSYAIRRHAEGNGRKDILTLGERDAATPFLQVEIYRPGSEKVAPVIDGAASLAPAQFVQSDEPLPSKFGPLTMFSFQTSAGVARHCLGFMRSYSDPNFRLSGWFCQGGEPVARSTLACALDRLTLLAAGSEPKVGALFAQAELNRSFCGQREPLMAATPKYRTLWQAVATKPAPQRAAR